MYSSLRSWLTLTASIQPFISMDGAGDAQYGDAFEVSCYVHGKVSVVRDKNGNEVVSNRQMYVDGAVDVSYNDLITFQGEPVYIKALSTFYDGNNGKESIKVIYL